ncbi:MAG: metallophosphoesterase family protein [Deltaproteobacteria bacterium]|nr:metallophosphoesterase family protein [Deltaproteobacteria bacterium]
MRYGILSDVHGNLEALTVVLEKFASMDLDAYIFLGDAVGYGASPNEVCALLRDKVKLSVLGNHDAAVAGRMDYADYYPAARNALRWCSENLEPSHMQWLKEMPYWIEYEQIGLCHGLPFNAEAFEYMFNSEQIRPRLDEIRSLPAITFIGHSHLTVSFCIDGEKVTPLMDTIIECRPDARYIITVGSVGQPRDRDPRACCGVYDSEQSIFTYHRFEYDIHSARQKIIDAGLPTIFGDRLLMGT